MDPRLLIGITGPAREGYEPTAPSEDETLDPLVEMAAKEFLAAIKAGNTMRLVRSLRALCRAMRL